MAEITWDKDKAYLIEFQSNTHGCPYTKPSIGRNEWSNTTVFERSELRSISFSSEKRREPVRASMGLAFFGSFFGHAKNERPSGSDNPL